MKAFLLNREVPVLSCEIENNRITKIYEIVNKDRLPVPLTYDTSLGRANKWLEDRLIPEKREGLRGVRMSFSSYKTPRSNMLSLSDQYWFMYHKQESWGKLNFFRNDYQEEIGKMFFTPWNVDEEKAKGPSPDMTTNGVLRKAWVREDGGISRLYKAGSVTYHQEPLSEVLASMVLEKLQIIPFVRYELAIHGLQICSRCANFVTEDTEFVPAAHVYNREPKGEGESHFTHMIRMSKAYGIEEEETKHFLARMIVADTIMCNTDRHLNNFGFIRGIDGRFIGFAPLFDSGDAFRGNAVKDKDSKLFGDRKEWAFKRMTEHLPKDSLDLDDMLTLTDNYPIIDDERRSAIKKQVLRVNRYIQDKTIDEIMF